MDKENNDKESDNISASALKGHLTDAGSYSYAAICALSLHELFSSEWDMPYSKDCIKKIIEHLDLPRQVLETMESLVCGYGVQSYQAYVEMLMSEPAVSNNPIVVIQDLILFGIQTGQYDARTRVLVIHVAGLLGAPRALAQLAEENLGHSLLSETKKEEPELTEEQKNVALKKQRRRKLKRYALIGLATVGGGALLGVTGGLAAPLIGAGVGVIVGGGAAAAAIGSVAGAAIVGSLFGLAGAGLTGYRMKRRVGEIDEFEFGRLTQSEEQLHIVIAVSGWLNEGDENFNVPWQCLSSSREQYFLRYESVYLLELGNAMDILMKAAMSSAVQHMLKFTLLRGLLAAVAWPATLLSLSHVIDNPWGTCLRRSAQVGRHLAEVILTKQHGGRPVTLVGFSLGARVIFYCLRELADRMPGSEGLVQDAVMLGAPVTGSKKDWQDISTVVAGKIVNGYCKSDWLLKFLYRTTSAQVTIAGLDQIDCGSKRIKNVDLTDVVNGHQEYINNIETILKIVGVCTTEVSQRHVITKSASEVMISGHGSIRKMNTSHSVPHLETFKFYDTASLLENEIAEEAISDGEEASLENRKKEGKFDVEKREYKTVEGNSTFFIKPNVFPMQGGGIRNVENEKDDLMSFEKYDPISSISSGVNEIGLEVKDDDTYYSLPDDVGFESSNTATNSLVNETKLENQDSVVGKNVFMREENVQKNPFTIASQTNVQRNPFSIVSQTSTTGNGANLNNVTSWNEEGASFLGSLNTERTNTTPQNFNYGWTDSSKNSKVDEATVIQKLTGINFTENVKRETENTGGEENDFLKFMKGDGSVNKIVNIQRNNWNEAAGNKLKTVEEKNMDEKLKTETLQSDSRKLKGQAFLTEDLEGLIEKWSREESPLEETIEQTTNKFLNS